MKMYYTIMAVLLSVGNGCAYTTGDDARNISEAQSSALFMECAPSISEGDTLELNNGAKWKVVPEMMVHVRSMESDINRFSETDHTELKDYKQLGASLRKNIDLFTAGCTMSGKAHEELHKWLLPYIELVDKLTKSKKNSEAVRTLEAIRASLKTFNRYFE